MRPEFIIILILSGVIAYLVANPLLDSMLQAQEENIGLLADENMSLTRMLKDCESP